MTHGRDKEKYEKIYQKKGVMAKEGGYMGHYGENKVLDEKWDRYGHSFEGAGRVNDVLRLEPESMVDIGAGYNEFVKTIRSRISYDDSEFVGTDIACEGSDIIAPAHDLPFKNERFDLVVSFDCMEHIPEEEVPLAIKEFHRVGKRIYLQIALAHSGTHIDGEPLHVCVKPKEWWLENIEKYFPNVKIMHHEKRGTPWEHIIFYGTK